MLIICLVGLSGTGKSTVAENLVMRLNAAVNNPTTLIPGLTNIAESIKSYTTRAKRNEDDNDHTYVNDEYWKYVYEYERNNIVAFTKYGHHYYWVMRNQFDKQVVSVFVVDPKGVEDLKKANLKHSIFTVHVKLPEKEVVARLFKEYTLKHDVKTTDAMIKERLCRNTEAYANFQADFTIDNEHSFNTAQIILGEAIGYFPITNMQSVNILGVLRWALQ